MNEERVNRVRKTVVTRRTLMRGVGCTLAAATFPVSVRGSLQTGSGRKDQPNELPTPRQQHTCTVLPGGRILATGGFHVAPLASAAMWDPETRRWSPIAPMCRARFNHAAVALPDGRVLVSGGQSQSPLASVEIYDPETDTWSEAAPMRQPRVHHAAVVLDDGQVLIAGGFGYGPLASVEIYKPSAGRSGARV